MLARFDRWAARSPVSVRDLSVFRMIYAVSGMLLAFRPDSMVAMFPAAGFFPPPGPFRLLTEPPPVWAVTAIAAALALSFALLLVGWRTVAVSLICGVLQIVVFGIGFSYGKIDHQILFPLVPLALAWSGWGGAYSLDARRSPGGEPGWGPRLLAVLIGVGFFTSGLAKLGGGWLDLGTQAGRSQMVFYGLGGSEAPVYQILGAVSWAPMWEVVDWFIVLVELSALVAALLSWRAFRIVLCLLALLHLAIQLTLGIEYGWNLIVYAAFVPWARVLRIERWRVRPPRPRPAVVLGSAVIVAAVAWAVGTWWPKVTLDATLPIVVVVGSAIAAAALVDQAWSIAKRVLRR